MSLAAGRAAGRAADTVASWSLQVITARLNITGIHSVNSESHNGSKCTILPDWGTKTVLLIADGAVLG